MQIQKPSEKKNLLESESNRPAPLLYKFRVWRELSFVLLLTFLIFMVTGYFNIFNPLSKMMKGNAGSFIDESYLALNFLLFGLLWFGFRWWNGYHAEITNSNKATEVSKKILKAFDASQDVIFMTDENGVFSYVNPVFTDLYGYAAEDIIGKASPRILKSDHLTERDYKMLWSTIISEKNFKKTIKNKKKDGTLVDIETSINALLSEHGSITGFIAIQRGISERKATEKNSSEPAHDRPVENPAPDLRK